MNCENTIYKSSLLFHLLRVGLITKFLPVMLCLLVLSINANALVLSEPKILSTSYAPLEAEINISGVEIDMSNIIIDLAPKLVHQSNGIPYQYNNAGIKTSLKKRSNGSFYVKLSTITPISTKKIDFLLLVITNKTRHLKHVRFSLKNNKKLKNNVSSIPLKDFIKSYDFQKMIPAINKNIIYGRISESKHIKTNLDIAQGLTKKYDTKHIAINLNKNSNSKIKFKIKRNYTKKLAATSATSINNTDIKQKKLVKPNPYVSSVTTARDENFIGRNKVDNINYQDSSLSMDANIVNNSSSILLSSKSKYDNKEDIISKIIISKKEWENKFIAMSGGIGKTKKWVNYRVKHLDNIKTLIKGIVSRHGGSNKLWFKNIKQANPHIDLEIAFLTPGTVIIIPFKDEQTVLSEQKKISS